MSANQHLARVLSVIDTEKQNAANSKKEMQESLQSLLSYAAENFYQMDPQEVATTRNMIDRLDFSVELFGKREKLLERARKSAFFGRIEFQEKNREREEFYIGIAGVQDRDKPLVCDWRAPISSLYYDSEIGRATYAVPDGQIEGELLNKTQYGVREDNILYQFDSSVAIGDVILKQTLSEHSDGRMKNIVASIQREQNNVIRKNLFENTFVHGVAGSGKTSIALHKAAYLLYQNHSKLKADEILILSPSSRFSSYIENVLPELGENNILSQTFFDFAKNELGGKFKLQSQEMMLEEALADKVRQPDIEVKFSFDYLEKLNDFLNRNLSLSFHAKDIVLGDKKVPKEKIQKLFSTSYKDIFPSKKIGWICETILEDLNLENAKDIFMPRLKTMLLGMFEQTNLADIFSDFLKTARLTDTAPKGIIFYEDIPSVLFIKNFLVGLEKQEKIKYLIVDEMQDYSPLHFELFKQMFDCRRIFLGDINQNIFVSEKEGYVERMAQMFESSTVMNLTKSYRQTKQLCQFASRISGIISENVLRNGEKPYIFMEKTEKEHQTRVEQVAQEYAKKYNEVAILCKTIKQKNCINRLTLPENVTVLSPVETKGIEFDAVIIPFADDENYHSEVDRNLLYILSTRALHSLTVVCTKNLSKFVPKETV